MIVGCRYIAARARRGFMMIGPLYRSLGSNIVMLVQHSIITHTTYWLILHRHGQFILFAICNFIGEEKIGNKEAV